MSLSYTSILAGASGQSSGYTIPYSCRFVSGNSGKLVRTSGGTGSRTTATFSAWIKLVNDGSTQNNIFAFGATDVNNEFLIQQGGGYITLYHYSAAAYQILYRNTGIFVRDYSAWGHLVVTIDTTAGSGSRVKMWWNNVQQTAWTSSTEPSASQALQINLSGNKCVIGARSDSTGTLDAYLSNVYWIDGQALTPSSFGQTNTSGVWVPKAYAGTYGTNGFLMAFANSAALGTDTSGNANTFTSSGLTSADQVTDTPTNNYATFNPLVKNNTTGSIVLTYSAGNLRAVGSAANGTLFLYGTIPFSSGKHRMEATVTNLVETVACGITPVNKVNTVPAADHLGNGICQYFAYTLDGKVYNNNVNVATNTASSLVDGELIACEVDLTNGVIEWFHKDSGVWTSRGTYSFTPSGDYVFGIQINDNGCDVSVNFGQKGFDGTPTSGFGALCTSRLAAPAIKDGSAHFQSTLYTSNGSTLTVTQSGNSTFEPGLAWLKMRTDAGYSNRLFDVLRGVTKHLRTNGTDAETTTAASLTAFNSNGFSLGSYSDTNESGSKAYVGWQWKAGGAGVSNSVGSITSTVSANPTAGFSVVTYTGTGTAGTIGHGLGVAPKLIIVKARSGVTQGWHGYHASLGNGSYVVLNTTAAVDTGAIWNSASPDSSKFSVGSSTWPQVNSGSGTYVAYCFAEIDGFSKIGSYTGNGSADGPFVYCGFRPAWVMWKNASAAATDWVIKDTSRDTYNVMTTRLFADLSSADDVNAANDLMDYVSNGFKIRSAGGAQTNGSGNTIIYAAFASNPFGGSGAAPATAR